jgi:hypothetical protein
MRESNFLQRMRTPLKFSEHNPIFCRADSTANGTASDDTTSPRRPSSTFQYCQRARCPCATTRKNDKPRGSRGFKSVCRYKKLTRLCELQGLSRINKLNISSFVSSKHSRTSTQMSTTTAHSWTIEGILMISTTVWHSSALTQSQKSKWELLWRWPRVFMKLVYRFLV